ncbi:MAG: hypothetical protein JO336_18260, partial [Acidobacteriia bacterium]|nr:hypothetical protein [Terriglobia bacterium]
RSRRFAQWERSFAQFAIHRKQAIIAAAVLPVITRLALLPALPIPQPLQPDEFGYLLLADTFASGRITNPTHPLWRYFETLYVFHQPTYTSLYPIVQGLLLAVPIVLRAHPWFAVCASMGLMCAALTWMLQAWLPPKWALLGAAIAAARFSIATYWINSYWGGASGAIGGALLLGGLPRLIRQARVRDALLTVLGVAILSQSRPFEGALLTLPIAALLIYRLARDFARDVRRNWRILATLVGGIGVIALATLYYNWRVTGHALLWPYQWHQQIYGTPPNLRWSKPVLSAAHVAAEPDILANFQWQRDLFQAQSTWRGLAAALPEKLSVFWDFYFQPLLTLPLIFVALWLGRPRVRWLAILGAFVLLAGFTLYPFFFPHYAAPVCGLLLALIVEGTRRMKTLRWQGKRAGALLFRWWVIACAASYLAMIAGAALAPNLAVTSSTPRSEIEQALKLRGGKHLVLVRYTPAHNFHHPWIYNAADIDRSPIVWARASEALDPALLLRYFADRQVWIVTVRDDEETPALVRYAQPGSQKPRSADGQPNP